MLSPAQSDLYALTNTTLLHDLSSSPEESVILAGIDNVNSGTILLFGLKHGIINR